MSGFTIPNTPEATATQNQAEPDSLDFQIIGKQNSGVISGLNVTPASGTNVAVSAGEVLIEGFYYPFTGTPSLALTAYSTIAFFDVVVARLTAGVISCHVIPGSQTTNPRFPSTGASGSTSVISLSTDVVLASVWRPSNSAVLADQIVDKRVIVRSNATRVNATVLENTTGAVGDFHVNTSWSADTTLKSPVYVKEDSTWYRLARWPEDGNFSAGTITASLTGNASTASKWATTRTLSITGNGTGSTTWDGSGNASLNLTVGYAATAPWTGITGKPTDFVYNNGGSYTINVTSATSAGTAGTLSSVGHNAINTTGLGAFNYNEPLSIAQHQHSGAHAIAYRDENNFIRFQVTDQGNIGYVGPPSNLSDERMKEGIYKADLSKLSNSIDKLVPKHFKYKGSDEEYLGFIAQDVQKDLSEAVTSFNEEMLALRMDVITVALVAKCQELERRLALLEAQ